MAAPDLKRRKMSEEELSGTSFPKNKIKVLLLEGVSAKGIQILKDDGFQRACSERLIVLAGACLLMLEMALQVAAMTLLTDSVPAELAHAVLIFFYALSIVALAASVFLARLLPPAMAIAILFSIGAVGCVGMAVFFTTGSGCVSLVWVSYGCLCAMTPTFSLTFSLVASLADVSGQRSAMLSCGAALGPLATAVLATANPCMLWFAFTALVVVSIIGVLVLEKVGVAS